MSNRRKDEPVHIRNAHALLQGIEKMAREVSALNARMAAMDNRMLALERQVATSQALMGSGMFRAGTGSTVPDD
jgi:hypothetical protein